MDIDVQDGRLQNHRPLPLQRNNESSSVLIQALETSDTDLLDWCIENKSPPDEISLSHLAHLLNFLSSRYWVYSQTKVLAWIHTLLVCNISRLHKLEEFRPVLEDLKAKMQAKVQGINQLSKLKSKL